MNRMMESDEKLKAGFDITEHKLSEGDEVEIHFRCKNVNEEGEPCPRGWAVDPNADGTIDTGIRNALLSHIKAHEGGFRKMRRIS